MARKGSAVVAEQVVEDGGIKYGLSPARATELERKIQESRDYYFRTFNVTLTHAQVLGILQRAVERDKERLFVNKIGLLSEADILWFGERYGLLKKKGSNGAGQEGGTEAVSESSGEEDSFE